MTPAHPCVRQLLGHQASFCTADVSPGHGTLGPREELQLSLELTTHTRVSRGARGPEGPGRHPVMVCIRADREVCLRPTSGLCDWRRDSCIWVCGPCSC